MNRLTFVKRHFTKKEQTYIFYQLDLIIKRMAVNASSPRKNHPSNQKKMIADRAERFLKYCKTFADEYDDEFEKTFDINHSAMKNIRSVLSNPISKAVDIYGNAENEIRDETSKELSRKLMGYYDSRRKIK